MITKQQLEKVFRPWIRFIKFRILHVDDSPHNLALGVAVGLFMAWLPAIGIQILFALAAAIILRANKFLALTFVWVSNVFTYGIIYLPNFLIGKFLLDIIGVSHESTRSQVARLMEMLGSFSILKQMWQFSFWQRLWRLTLDIGAPLWLGSFLLATLIAAVSYYSTFKLIIWYRTKNPRRRYRKHMP